MISIEISTFRDYEKLRSNLRVARQQLPSFQRTALRRITEEIVLPKIHQRMAQANYSSDLIASTVVSDVFIFEDTFQVVLSSELLSTDTAFDLAKAREFGTAPHDIWSSKPHELLVFEKSGETVFVSTKNKPVKHPGTKGENIIKQVIEEQRGNVEVEFLKQEEAWFRSIVA